MKIENLEQALDVFEEKTTKHGKLSKAGESARKLNYEYKGIIESVRWLYKNGNLISLSKFYKSHDIKVRSWAATFLLEIDTQNAVQVLEQLTKLNDSESENLLLEYREGNLDIDFYKK